jgi:hypothetical protein
MSNWYIDYHHAQLLRLLSIGFVFGVQWPILCWLAAAGHRLVTRIAAPASRETRPAQVRWS